EQVLCCVRMTRPLEEWVCGPPHRREARFVGQLHLVEPVLKELVLVVRGPRPRQRKFVEQGNLHLLPPWKIERSCWLVSDVPAMCLGATYPNVMAGPMVAPAPA